jgi:hypothetical protein
MKLKLFIIALISFTAINASGQSFFKPLPKMHEYLANHLSLAVVDSSDLTMNAFRPVVAISASVSNGTSLASGFGIGLEHLKWDQASQSWLTVYSISALGFLTTNGSSIGGTAGLVFGIPGTNGLISVGPGYDVTGKQIVFLSGVQIQFK